MLIFYTNLQATTKFYYIFQTATYELTTTITNLLLITLIYLRIVLLDGYVTLLT